MKKRLFKLGVVVAVVLSVSVLWGTCFDKHIIDAMEKQISYEINGPGYEEGGGEEPDAPEPILNFRWSIEYIENNNL